MLRKHFRHTIAGLLALAFATSLFARGQFWDFLGYTQVDGSQDHGRIQITRRDVHFRTIQLRVSGEAIFFDRLVVHFDDGTSQELMVSDRISPGGRNYVIDLLGERLPRKRRALVLQRGLGAQSESESVWCPFARGRRALEKLNRRFVNHALIHASRNGGIEHSHVTKAAC